MQGLLVLALLAAIYILALDRGMPTEDLRALVFVSLVMANMALVLVNRSFGFGLAGRHGAANRAPALVYTVAAIVLAVAIYWPPAQALFHFGTFHLHDLAVAIGGCLLLIAVLEILKRLLHSRLAT